MRLRIALLIMAVLCATLSLSAQDTTGSIRGVVKDPSGAVLANATVTITNTDQNVVVRTVQTGSEGAYVAPMLPVGNYSITVTVAGFTKTVLSGIKVNVNDRLTYDVSMKVAGTQQEVTVEEAPIQVDLQTPQSAGLITGTQVREIAVLSRNFIQLVTLQPGVSTDMATDQLFVGASNPTGLSNQINISVNGSRPSQNSFLVDGADDMNRGANLTLLAYPSIDSIAEFKVLRSNYLPEHGRTSSGEISVVTRGGTNQIHGSAYEFFRNDVLNANDYFLNAAKLKRPPMRWNDFGFTLGGPIKKNNTFFFYSQEWRRFIKYTPFTSGELPSGVEMQGNFPTAVCTAFDASGNCSATGTSISNINPVAAAYVKDIYSKLAQANLGDKLVSTGRNVYNYREEAVRVDHNFGQKVTVFGRFTHDSIPTQEPGGLYTGLALPGVATTQSNSPARSFSGHVTATLSPTLINDAGYNYSWGGVITDPIGLMSLTNSPDVRPTLPFASNSGNVPFLSFDTVQGLTGFGPYRVYNTNHSIFDTLAKTMGTHSLKFGGVFNYFTLNENSNNNASFYIDASANCVTGSPAGCAAADGSLAQNWANFLLGRVTTFTQSQSAIQYDLNQKQFEFFGQDEWRVRSNLTIHYGIRYSLFMAPNSANNLLSTFDPALYNAAAAPAVTTGPDPNTAGNYFSPLDPTKLPGLIQAGHNSPWGQAIVRTDKTNFAPRFGFAWDPFKTGKTSVRGGFGMFYGTNSLDNHEYSQDTNPTFSPAYAYYSNTNLSKPTGPASGPNLAVAPPTIYGPNPLAWHAPYTEQFNLDIQHQFTRTTMLDVGYFGNLGRHLMGTVDINMPQPLAFQNIPGYCAQYAPKPCYFHAFDYQVLNQIRPYRGYDAINLFSSVYTSSYNGLQAQFQKQFSSNSQVVVNYTWSHDLTDASENFRGAQNTYNLKGDWGNSIFDRRHVFSASYVYFLPFFKNQKGVAGHLLGGWEVSGVLYLTSGRHYDPGVSSCREDFAGLGLCGNTWSADRPDMIADPNNGPQTIAEWFNTSAFVIPGCTAADPKCRPTNPPLRPGDAHRGVIVGPGVQRWDASIFKNTKLTERFSTQFRAEFFNALNHTNLAQGAPVSGLSTTRTSGLFGQILNARDPRNIQFALKLLF